MRESSRNRREGHKWRIIGRRGLRAQSGKVRWACRFSLMLVKFSRQKVDPTDESVLQATLREAKEEVGIIWP